LAVVNNAPVEATYTNSKLMSRTTDTSTTGKVSLENTSDVNSGAIVSNSQRAHNETFDAVGMTGIGDSNRNVYSSNEVITDGDDRKEAIGKLDQMFNLSAGHAHSGAAGDGAVISAEDLDNINKYEAHAQVIAHAGASGTTVDITAEMTGKVAGGGPVAYGVITDPPFNMVAIRNSTTATEIEDAGGQKVYGRITYSAPNWSLDFFTNEAGTETSHSLASQDIEVMFWEVFSLETRPTIPSNPLGFGTLDITGDVVDATTTQRGVVSTGTQSFGGAKTFIESAAITKSVNAFSGLTTTNSNTGSSSLSGLSSSNGTSSTTFGTLSTTHPFLASWGFISNSGNGIFFNTPATKTTNFAQGGTTQAFINSNGGFVVSTGSAMSTSATGGFFAIPIMNGAPSGTPASYTANVSQLVVNKSQSQLYFYSSGWRKVLESVITTSGSIPYYNNNRFEEDAGFLWDFNNKYLGVGTGAPVTDIDATNTRTGLGVTVRAQNLDSATGSYSSLLAVNDSASGTIEMKVLSSTDGDVPSVESAGGPLSIGSLDAEDVLLKTTGTQKAKIPAAGGFAVTTGTDLSTTATDGFLYVAKTTGTPTGVPSSIAGSAPIVVDSGANKLWIYSGGSWVDVSSTVTFPISATNGGTGQSTYTTGDILYSSASNVLSKRSIGSTNQVLTVIGGVPTWQTPAAVVTYTWNQGTPTGSINGSNTAFTLSSTPAQAASVDLYLDGLYQRQGTDYTISGTSITMTTAPATSQNIWAKWVT
jgi:hypothetical protein